MLKYKTLIDLIDTFYPFEHSDLEKIIDVLKKVNYKKNTILLSEGDICDKIYFLEKGMIREYILNDNGEDLSTEIVIENEFFFSTLSFLSQKPSNRWVETLEDCTIIYLKKEDFLMLQEEVPILKDFLSFMYEKSLIKLEQRNELLKIKQSESRIKAFENAHPELQNRIQYKHLASYINITPETLSRVKSKKKSNLT